MVILFPQEQAKVNNRKRERARSTFFISPKNKFHLCRPAKRENILIHKIMNRALHGQGNIDGWLGADGFPFRVPPFPSSLQVRAIALFHLWRAFRYGRG
jgi:hypothetical protein